LQISNKVVVIIFLSLVLVSCVVLILEYINQQPIAAVPLNHTVASSMNFSKYENSSFGILVKYPSDWKKIEDFRGSWFRNMNESANVRVESTPFQKGNLEEFTMRQINSTGQQFPGREIVESNETKIGDNYTAHRIVFTFPVIPADLEKTKEMQVWTVNGGRAYIISYFTKIDDYDKYLPTAQKIIDSFRIK
jgi:hypothetical protein